MKIFLTPGTEDYSKMKTLLKQLVGIMRLYTDYSLSARIDSLADTLGISLADLVSAISLLDYHLGALEDAVSLHDDFDHFSIPLEDDGRPDYCAINYPDCDSCPLCPGCSKYQAECENCDCGQVVDCVDCPLCGREDCPNGVF